MCGNHFFHAARRETMTGDVDDVVSAAHDPQITIVVFETRVPGFVVAGISIEVRPLEAGAAIQHREKTYGREGKFDCDIRGRVRGDFFALVIHDSYVVTRHRHTA